jgi:hypothetical protein
MNHLALPLHALAEKGDSSVLLTSSPPIHNLSDLKRAIDFLSRVDDLVWARSHHPLAHKGSFDVAFKEENVEALFQRLALWESIVRNPFPR